MLIKAVIVNSATDTHRVQHPISRKIKHLTLLATVVAFGSSLTPMLVTSADIPQHLAEKWYCIGHDVICRTRQSPYINAEFFYYSTQAVFIPYIRAARQNPMYAHEPAVLMMNSFSGHLINVV